MSVKYKVLIVDDEPPILQKLSETDWSQLGVELAGTALNGMEALQIYHERSPDIIITDISMPLMDGLELISRIKQEDETVAFILLTINNQFGIAKQAISLGVADYLLKGFYSDNDMRAAIQKAITVLEKNRSEEKNRLLVKSDREITAFNQLINQNHTSLSIPSPSHLVSVLINSSSPISTLYHLNLLSWSYHLKDHYMGIINVHYTSNNTFDIFLTHALPTHAIEKLCAEISQLFSDTFQEDYNISCCICGRLEHIRDYISLHKRGASSLKLSFYEKGNRIFTIPDHEQETAAESSWILSQISQKLISICQDLSAMEAYLLELGPVCVRYSIQPKTLMNLFLACILHLKKEWVSQTSEAADKIDEAVLTTALTYEELCNGFLGLLHNLNSSKRLESRFEINRAIEIITQNLDKPLSLSYIAQEVGFSPGYLSHLFKKNMDINFKDFVTKLRMEKAADLLRTTNLKVYEVAELTGFPNYRHFSVVFQEYYHISPMKFKDGNGHGE